MKTFRKFDVDLMRYNDDTVKVVTAAETLNPEDVNVEATLPAAGTYAITLPKAELMPGSVIKIKVTVDGAGDSVTIAPQSSDQHAYGGATLTAVKDYAYLESTGEGWIELAAVET